MRSCAHLTIASGLLVDRIDVPMCLAGSRIDGVVRPILEGVDVSTPLPACPALRGQPCREYVAPKAAQ